MREIKAPNVYEQDETAGVFLAGSIEMGAAPNWQEKVVAVFEKKKTPVTILNPRRDDWDSTWEQSIFNEDFVKQVRWELNALELADYILMYFAPGTKSPISLLEFGLHARTCSNMHVVCPPGFWRKGNIDVVCHKYSVRQHNTIEEAAGYIAENIMVQYAT